MGSKYKRDANGEPEVTGKDAKWESAKSQATADREMRGRRRDSSTQRKWREDTELRQRAGGESGGESSSGPSQLTPSCKVKAFLYQGS